MFPELFPELFPEPILSQLLAEAAILADPILDAMAWKTSFIHSDRAIAIRTF
ncbi:MAG: hypothetical protein WBA57_00670 [Elainellaceae cyanobacterium]